MSWYGFWFGEAYSICLSEFCTWLEHVLENKSELNSSWKSVKFVLG